MIKSRMHDKFMFVEIPLYIKDNERSYEVIIKLYGSKERVYTYFVTIM